MARQFLVPGYGIINETGTREYLIPGYGIINEDIAGEEGNTLLEPESMAIVIEMTEPVITEQGGGVAAYSMFLVL